MFRLGNITPHLRTPFLTVVLVAAQASATIASTSAPAAGTFTPTGAPASVAMRVADGNTFLEITGQPGAWTGTIAGTTSENIRGVIHKDGSTNFSGQLTCSCVVEGRAGTVTVRFNISGGPSGLSGHYRIVASSGGLAGLHGEGTLSGSPTPPGTYRGTYHFE